MADAITALVQLGPSLVNLATGLITASDTAKRNAQLIEFQSALIGFQSLIASVQQENATLASQKRDAEDELKQMKDWEGEKKRYQMVEPYSGVTAFAVKKNMNNGEPPHYLCANCFQSGKKSFLTKSGNKDGWIAIVCSACKFTSQTRTRGLSGPQYAEDVTTE